MTLLSGKADGADKIDEEMGKALQINAHGVYTEAASIRVSETAAWLVGPSRA